MSELSPCNKSCNIWLHFVCVDETQVDLFRTSIFKSPWVFVSFFFLILQGMGYLHAKGILHKDLKSKNVFYDNGKVVITDFGLFSISGVLQAGR